MAVIGEHLIPNIKYYLGLINEQQHVGGKVSII